MSSGTNDTRDETIRLDITEDDRPVDYMNICQEYAQLAQSYAYTWRRRMGVGPEEAAAASYNSLPGPQGRIRSLSLVSPSFSVIELELGPYAEDGLTTFYELHGTVLHISQSDSDHKPTLAWQEISDEEDKALALRDINTALFDADVQEKRGNRL